MAAFGSPLFASLFPATAKAQQEAFAALIDAREAKDPESRARALSNSVLAKAYATAGQGGNRRGRSKQEEAEEAMFEQQKQVSEAFEKMERQKHLAQTMERVNNAYTVWDNRPGARDDSTRAVADVKRAISRWLVDGETREQHAAKIADLLRELDGWLQHENAMPPPAAADADGVSATSASVTAASDPAGTAVSDDAAPAHEDASEEDKAVSEVMSMLDEKQKASEHLAQQVTLLLKSGRLKERPSGAGTLASVAAPPAAATKPPAEAPSGADTEEVEAYRPTSSTFAEVAALRTKMAKAQSEFAKLQSDNAELRQTLGDMRGRIAGDTLRTHGAAHDAWGARGCRGGSDRGRRRA